MTTLPPPLLGFTLYHRSMREGVAALRRVLADAPDDDRLEDAAAWFAHFRRACLLHAEGEDKVLWPALAVARDDLGEVFATMDEEHTDLHRVLDDLAAAFEDPSRAAERVGLADELLELLTRHLDGEEHDAVPALIESLGDELGDLMRRVQQSAGPSGAAVAVPFLLEHATDDERAAVLAALPPPVRDGLSTWERDYRRLADPIRG